MSVATVEPLPQAMDLAGCSWAGRQVAVVGLGRSGLAAATLLCRLGCRVRVTELRRTDQLTGAQQMLYALGAEVVELGGHTRELITDTELVVVSPGISDTSAPLQWALEAGIPILSEIELAFQFCPAPIVAVTGTNGKSTAVTLIADIINAMGHRAVACGNLGVPFASVVERLTSQSIAVVEVSSFQLLWCRDFRPKIGVLLNIGTNHLDRHQDPTAYLAAKARLFQRQTPQDWAVLNGMDPKIVAMASTLQAHPVWFGENRSNSPAWHLAPQTRRALGEGAQAVLQVARLLSIPDVLTWQILRGFQGLEHRLEHVAMLRGIQFVNDSKSTTPESCLYALHRIRGDVVVILGGRDKGLDFAPLIEALHHDRVKGVVLIGEARHRLRPLLNGSSIVRERDTLPEAVRAAVELADAGTTVLFSPACASFDMFHDFEERGRAFKTIVTDLAGAAECSA